jgi:hypothetical protein
LSETISGRGTRKQEDRKVGRQEDRAKENQREDSQKHGGKEDRSQEWVPFLICRPKLRYGGD